MRVTGAYGAASGGSSAAASTTITTTPPLTGGGDLSANRTIGIQASSASQAGGMSAAQATQLAALPATLAAGFFALDVTLVGGTKTQASGRTLSSAIIVAVLLKTATTAVGNVTATISSNNVIVTSYAAGAVQAVTDASTYTVMLVGAV